MKKILQLVALILVIGSVLPHLVSSYWFLDALSNFKVQLLVLLLVCLGAIIIFRLKKILLYSVLTGIAWNLYFIVPLYAPFDTKTASHPDDHSLVTINLLSSNREFSKVREYIASINPDFLVLQEYNSRWATALSEMTENFPYKLEIPQSNNFGIAVFSKVKMTTNVIGISEFPPTIRATIYDRGVRWILYASHPFPPAGQDRFSRRNKHYRWLAREVVQHKDPVLLTGDLNTSSFSPKFIRFVRDAGLNDARKGFGIRPTWPAGYWPVQITLDHVLTNKEIVISNYETGPDIGSDHLPVKVKFRIVER